MRLVFSEFKERSLMTFFATASRSVTLSVLTLGLMASGAQALDLDWHGQFRGETNTIFGYTHGVAAGNGYTIPNNGDSTASFQNLFFRLKPRALVNDNISIHSDIWFGAPDTGLFGSNGSTNHVKNSIAGNSIVSAEEFYAELASDFGTVRVGRVPLQYGLGLVWNNDPSDFDRLPSNGDAITLVTKLGAFKFMPSIVKYQDHYSSSSPAGASAKGSAGVSDYALALAYNNDDEQLDASILFMRRLAGQNANVVNPLQTTGTSGFAYNLWDFYARKKAGIFTLKAELPLTSGIYAGTTYSSVSGVLNADADLNDHWKLKLNAGSASGQASGSSGKLTAFYFHPDYRPGLLMFNYNFKSIATNSGSPYDNGITNARFLALSADYTSGKFSHEFKGIYALADQVADGSTAPYFNTYSGRYETPVAGQAQEKGLGFEMDYLLGYEWDEAVKFGVNLGLYFPGKFYDYSAAATPNTSKTVFGTNLNMLVKF